MGKIDFSNLQVRNVLTNNITKVFLGGVILGGTSVVGASMFFDSDEIAYKPTDENWEVSNVSDAINSLYDDVKNKINVLYLGSSTTYDLKTDYEKYGLKENDYKKLTNDSFITGINSGSITATGSCSAYGSDAKNCYAGADNGGWATRYGSCGCTPSSSTKNFSVTHSYNNETGILTLTTTSGISNVVLFAYIIDNI